MVQPVYSPYIISHYICISESEATKETEKFLFYIKYQRYKIIV